MAQANLIQFQQVVLKDTMLQQQLRATAERESFVALALRLSAERGCPLAAVRYYEASAGRLVNYRQLPAIVWSSLLDFFKVRYSAADMARMRYVTQFHAKNPALYFKADSITIRSAASDPLREIGRRYLKQVYEQLEQLRLA